MAFCLPKKISDVVLKAIRSGEISPEKLISMTSEQRREFLSKYVGNDAKIVNALLESKLILKDYKRGLVSWVKKITGLSPEVKRDMISKIEKLQGILTPKDEASFLEDLIAMKLGTDVSLAEAAKISSLSKSLSEAESKLTPETQDYSPEAIDYGQKRVALMNYVNELKHSNEPKGIIQTIKEIRKNPLTGSYSALSKLAGFSKAISSSFDLSGLLRQGGKTLFSHPEIWAKNAMDNFSNIFNQMKRKGTDNEVMDTIIAGIISRKNARNGNYKKMKLDIGTGEESFPTSLPEKVPAFGRLYKTSQTAYEGFLYKLRADLADKMIRIAESSGVDLRDSFQMESIGRMVNSLTGRGNLGAFEKVGKELNVMLFSPKFLKSQIDFLTMHMLEPTSSFARKQAVNNLLKNITALAAIYGIANAFYPKSTEEDARSSDFGKIRVGNTRFDISSGAASLVTLAMRALRQSTKSSSTGKISSLNTGDFGSKSTSDLFFDFLTNKFSPAARTVMEIANQRDFSGQKVTPLSALSNLVTPLPMKNAYELMTTPNAAPVLLGIMADALGISTNTYK